MRMLILLCLLIPLSGFAAIYKHTDSKGNVTYSDQHNHGASEVKLPKDSRYKPRLIPDESDEGVLTEQSSQATEDIAHYTTFSIQSPRDEQTFQNTRQIPIEIDMQPVLRSGDRIQLFLNDDKKPAVETTETAFTVQILARDEYRLRAKIVDAQGKVVKTSQVVTIYVHFRTKLLPKTPLTPISPPLTPLTPPLTPLTPASP